MKLRKTLGFLVAGLGCALAAGGALPKDRVPDQGMTWRRILTEIKAIIKILWWQGLRPSYRRQVWTQLLGMWRQNPTRFRQYLVTCVEGEDLFDMRKIVREKAAAIIKERQIEGPAALQGRLSAAPLEPFRSSAIQDK